MNQWILNKRYQLQKRLSRKGARHTFIAKDLQTNQLVVVKVLLFGTDFQWQDHKLFERGAAALKTLSYPGIPKYLDYFDVEIGRHKGFAQVQTYIPAKSLQQHLQSGRTFSEDELRQLALQILAILEYLHQRQPAVIHRDIKPSNILLESSTGNHVGKVYLVDFDSVKTGATRSDYTMTIVGTYGYMPPEQFSGNARPASDLYSLGATLIYAATGKHPADLPQKNMCIEFNSHVNLNPNLVTWLKWMTNPNLDRRLSSATLAIQALFRSCTIPKQALPQVSSRASSRMPTISKIIIRQTNHPKATEIIFPPKGLAPMTRVLLVLFGGPVGLSTLSWGLEILSAFASGQFLMGLVSSLAFLPPGLLAVLIAYWTLSRRPNLEQLTLRIESTTITETRTHRFRKTRHHSASRASLHLVSDNKISFVSLKTASHTFELPTETQADREWLMQTLSQQLQIPTKYQNKHLLKLNGLQFDEAVDFE